MLCFRVVKCLFLAIFGLCASRTEAVTETAEDARLPYCELSQYDGRAKFLLGNERFSVCRAGQFFNFTYHHDTLRPVGCTFCPGSTYRSRRNFCPQCNVCQVCTANETMRQSCTIYEDTVCENLTSTPFSSASVTSMGLLDTTFAEGLTSAHPELTTTEGKRSTAAEDRTCAPCPSIPPSNKTPSPYSDNKTDVIVLGVVCGFQTILILLLLLCVCWLRRGKGKSKKRLKQMKEEQESLMRMSQQGSRPRTASRGTDGSYHSNQYIEMVVDPVPSSGTQGTNQDEDAANDQN